MLKIFRQTSLDIDIPQMTIAKVEIKKLTNRAGVKSNGQITHYAPIKDVLTGKKAVSESDQKDMPSLEFGKDGFVKPESVQQVKADVKEQVRQKKAATPSIDMTTPMSFDDMKNIFKRMDSGDITIKELRQQWNRFIGNQDAVKADLNQKTKKELLNLSWFLGIARARESDRKPEILEMVLNRLKRQFAPIATTQGLYESTESVISRSLETLTDDFIQERAAKIKGAKERAASAPTPQPEPTSAPVPTPQPTVSATQPEPNKSKLSYGTTKHTKTGEDLHTVSMADRVSKDEFADLKAKAKEHGGYYSTYTKSFIFKSEDDAKKFASSEPSSTTSEPVAKTTPPPIDKIKSLAEKTIADAEAELSKERLTNTAKRARQAANAEAEARKRKQLGQTMLNVADAIASGESQHLNGLKSRSDFELLEQQLNYGRHNREKAENLRYDPNRKPSEKDLDHIKYPSPTIYKKRLADLVDKWKDTPGLKGLSKELADISRAHNNTTSSDIILNKENAAKLKQYVQALVDKKLINKSQADWILDPIKPSETLQRMGITNEEQLRAAAREYFGLRAQSDTPDPIKTLERKLIGKKFAGYFPTPQKLSAKIAETADIKPGMKVLEPSAGKGNLADAVLPFVGGKKDSITTIEPVGDLREILQAKGYKVTDDSDFLQHKGKYDRIVMNPPFENLQDADHVRHAYDLLEKGGKLVAITSPSPFFRQDKKAKEFRDWFESVGGTVENLPEGSFKTSDNPTGVSTRMVTITK